MNGDSINWVQPRQKPVHDYNKALIDFLSQPNTITSTAASTWMGDHQGRPYAVYLCPFVGVDLNL